MTSVASGSAVSPSANSPVTSTIQLQAQLQTPSHSQSGTSFQQQPQQHRGQLSTEDEADGDDEDGDAEEEEDDEGAEGGTDLLQEHTIKSGYLWKKGEKRKTWKKRWFVLRASKLAYYKNEKEYQLLRLIDMSEVHAVASVELKKNENSFGIVTPKRTYYVKTGSRRDMQDWIQHLNDVKTQIAQSATLTQDLAKTTLSPMTQQDPTQVAVPGIGVFHSPAQPRPIPSGSRMSPPLGAAAFSPLTATSDSDVSEAQKFGLSYASSFGQSVLGSSPARTTASAGPVQSTADRLSSGGYSPSTSHSGAEGSDQRLNRSASMSRRDRSVSESGGERLTLPGQATFSGGGASSAAGMVSSSEEEEEWDEEEGADRAMPLPALAAGGITYAPTNLDFAEQVAKQQMPGQLPDLGSSPAALTTAGAAANGANAGGSGSDFLRDPSRVILQGYLMKQSNRRKHWRKRWFVLTSSKLMYTRSHMDAKAHRQIPVASILDAIEYESKKAAKDTSSTLSSPTSVVKTFNFGSFGEAGESSAYGEGDVEGEVPGSGLSGASGTVGGSGGSGGGGLAGCGAPAIERRNSVIAAAGSVASSVGAGVGAAISGSGVGGSGRKRKENCFRIITPKRNFLICAPSEEEEIKWLSTLQTLISRVRDAQNEKEQERDRLKRQQSQKGSRLIGTTVQGFNVGSPLPPPAHQQQHQQQSSAAAGSAAVSVPKRTRSTNNAPASALPVEGEQQRS
ncbi:PH domain-like protein [Tilletiaria anomala UBC 951]|uniref:PH domain-like protein n=1 Tax=Tilletiaria anomala (strain ATCC 24038 / CBS 436.72 / UBC 951) TaxID=1037660 RepID=A0A066WG89_TILAU|nr:PH domain-like protein [Tilletiaria anomala UBC 951]KDN52982.1 PH domain-like protein [Tilletiaria anomala UBC 951]